MSLISSRQKGAGGLGLYWERRPAQMPTAPYAALVLRFMLAFFFCMHLYNKFIVTEGGIRGWFAMFSPTYPLYALYYVLVAEITAALLLPLGLRTRWVALLAVPDFIAIIQFWFHKGGFAFAHPGAEFPIMWLCMLVLQIILGDGAYSLKIARSR